MLLAPAMEALLTNSTSPVSWPRRIRRGAVGLALVAGAAVAAWQIHARVTRADPPPPYTDTEITRGDIVSQVTATGTLSPVVQVQVGSQVSGRVAELFADYNSEVEAGQVLVKLEPELFEGDVRSAKARLASANANLRKASASASAARSNYNRINGLGDSGIVSKAEIEAALASKKTADAQVTVAKSDVTQAEAALAQAETNLQYTTVKSPIDGVVVSRSIDVGQSVAASLSAPTLFVIAGDLRNMEVHTAVAESDVGQLAPGMKVSFTVDAFPDKTFDGVVKQVRYEAANVSNVVTYDAVVNVRNDKLELRPGMTANVDFITSEARDVLMVSNKALKFRPADAPRPDRSAWRNGATARNGAAGANGERAAASSEDRAAARASRGRVWVMRDGNPTMVRIQIGLTDGSNTEITGGELKEGDRVLTGGGPQAKGGAAAQRPAGGNSGNRGGGRRRGPPPVL